MTILMLLVAVALMVIGGWRSPGRNQTKIVMIAQADPRSLGACSTS